MLEVGGCFFLNHRLGSTAGFETKNLWKQMLCSYQKQSIHPPSDRGKSVVRSFWGHVDMFCFAYLKVNSSTEKD